MTMTSPYHAHVIALQGQTDQSDIELDFDPRHAQDELRWEHYTQRGPMDVEVLRTRARDLLTGLDAAYATDIPEIINQVRQEFAMELFADPVLELLVFDELDV